MVHWVLQLQLMPCSVPTVSSSDGSVSSNGCSRSQTRTWTARDACGNTSTASRTVTWIADLTAPTLTTGGTGTSLGCNPSAGDINGALGTATATDACSVPTVSSSDGNVTSEGCSRSQTRTFRAIDACGNTSTASRTVNWIADLTAPTLTTGGTGTSLGCNPSAGDINGALGTATATDACSVPTVSSSDGNVTSEGCSRSQTRTFRAIDALWKHFYCITYCETGSLILQLQLLLLVVLVHLLDVILLPVI
jgi:hypothetical protein